jgi:hypothetical protein
MLQNPVGAATIKGGVGERQVVCVAFSKFDPLIVSSRRPTLCLGHHGAAQIDARHLTFAADKVRQSPNIVSRPASYIQNSVAQADFQ